MVKAIMHGCNGKMGQVISNLVAADSDIEIVAGIDPHDDGHYTYPVYRSIFECDMEADVIIDFAAACAVNNLLDYSVKKKIPVVLCTTGLSAEVLAQVQETSKSVAVLKSANMSVGVNLILSVVKKMAETLYDSGFDIEIVEKHHNQKLDAPSGTALALADCMNQVLDNEYDYTYDRSTVRQKRKHNEIGISAVRGGTIFGELDVIFAGTDEVITFSHTAYSRAIFGKGAIQAAKYLAGKPAGFYHMSDVINAQV